MKPPARVSLVVQVADILRREIGTRRRLEALPSEIALAARLHVSRTTLRAAMKLLVHEGLLHVSRGRCAQVAAVPRTRGPRRAPVVGVLARQPLDTWSTKFYHPAVGSFYESYRDRLIHSGLRVECVVDPHCYQGGRPERRLDRLVREHRADLWVLTHSNQAMQRWFAARGILTLVDGSLHPDVPLPALDIDYEGACRHAVGTLLRFGHRQIAYLAVSRSTGGDVRSERGFHDGFRKFARHGEEGTIVDLGPSPGEVTRTLESLLRRTRPPTALLVASTEATFTALTFLLGRGVRVPRDLSLVCRDGAPFFSDLVPAVAHYRYQPDTYAQRLARMTHAHLSGTLPSGQQLIAPIYVKGASVGPAPANLP